MVHECKCAQDFLFKLLISCFQALNEKAKSITGVHQWPYRAVARALEVIPRTLIQNCGASTIRTLTALRVSGQTGHEVATDTH